MKVGIVGLPNVGKSTLFNALTKKTIPSENYPFCTIEPNMAVVNVPDERLSIIQKLYRSKKTIPAILEIVDIAGLVKGASKGEGLGNKFLSHIREVDAIIHVVRCFEDGKILHIDGLVNPIKDIQDINLELILADLEIVNKRLERVQRSLKSGDKKLLVEETLLKKLAALLEDEQPVRAYPANAEEQTLINNFALITAKPIIYCANVSENITSKNKVEQQHINAVTQYANKESAEVIVVSAKLEEDLATMPQEDVELFKKELGITHLGLDKLILAGYKLLGLISYITAGEQEIRAWTIENGTKAPQAAGKIHTDFEKGFIKAEVVSYNDLVASGSATSAKEKGLMRIEGKDYIVKDGDVILFRFNV